jgi:SAM-dependent methyltransferase
MGLYQKFILPRLIDMAMRNKEVAARRAQLIPKASGVVLEVGIGSGLNLPFFPRTITHLAGVDPSAELLSLARRKLGGVSFPVALFCRSAEELPFHERSFDTVVLTWTLCSIADPTQALAEVKRVLKPDGRLLFVEHGLSSDAKVQKWQHRLTSGVEAHRWRLSPQSKDRRPYPSSWLLHCRAADALPSGAEGNDLHLPGDCMSRLIGPSFLQAPGLCQSSKSRNTRAEALLVPGIHTASRFNQSDQ